MTRRAPSFCSFNSQWIYDVFINFRGEDTRHGFTGNLYNALCQRGIRTFFDDEELRRGEQISPALLKAIQGSRIAILVFSQNYASSTFCLIELVQVLEHLHGQGRLVLPVFYEVDPSDVRHQRGNYAQALAEHAKRFKDDKEKVQNWRLALHQAANLSGWHFKHGDKYEYEFIGKIVKEVSSKIDRKFLYTANYPVGLESRLLKVKSLIDLGLNDRVNMIGIYGIGGSGKSTIARALYNLIADQFECVCFLADISKKSHKLGLVLLQETLLSELVKEKDIKLGDVNQGIPILKKRLHEKKVLLILDDVDKIQQLTVIAGAPNWFGFGSTIIITTRDKHLLNIHGVDKKYEVQQLNHKEALELLSWNSFKGNKVDPNYMDILNRVVYYAQGLPLALEVIGSNLFGKSLNEWKSALDRYDRIPNKEVQQILKVSYDCLEEDEQKIFLDIASFYRDDSLDYVIDMVQHTWDFHPRYGVGVLVDKSLIKIISGIVTMHDLIQDMGMEIVRQESREKPGKRSRLWSSEDIIHILEENTGTNKIRVIIQNYLPKIIEVNWDGKAFKKMKNLRILIIGNARFSKGPIYLPNSLRVLKWPGYSSTSLPNDFHPRKLAILELRDSCLQSLEPIKRMENLSALNLSSCRFISRVPDISGCSNLRELLLKSCENLVEIHDSVGYLEKLETLSATYCAKLKKFPRSIKLRYLNYLGLTGCSSLENFPEILEKMEYITKLDLSFTNLDLPFSICNLIGLKELYIDCCKRIQVPSSIGMLPKVQWISIQGCEELQSSKQDEGQEEVNSMDYSNMKLYLSESNISDEFLPICLTFFANVQLLDLSRNNFTILPACIKECYHLLYLYLSDCKHLKEIRGIPPNIKQLLARNCTSLSSESRSILLSQKLLEVGDKRFVVPGASIPEWFDHCCKRPSFSFLFRNNFPMISLCFVITPPLVDKEPTSQSLLAKVIINGKEMLKDLNVWNLDRQSSLLADHILCVFVLKWSIFNSSELNKVLLKSDWNHMEVSMYMVPYLIGKDKLVGVKEIGMNVMKQGNRKEDIQFINTCKREKLVDLNWDSSFGVSTLYKEAELEGGIHAPGSINTEFESYWKQSAEDELKKRNASLSSSRGVVSLPAESVKLSEVPHVGKGKAGGSTVIAGSDDTFILLNEDKMLQIRPELFFHAATEAELECGMHAMGRINTEFDSYWKQCAEDELKKRNANPNSSYGVDSSSAEPVKLSKVPHVVKGKARGSVVIAGSDDTFTLLNENKVLQIQPELFLHTATDLQQQQSLTSISQEIPKNSISQQISKSSENIRIVKRKNVVTCKDNTDKEKDSDTLEELQEVEYIDIVVSRKRIPQWFDHCIKGGSVAFWVRRKFPGIAVFFLLGGEIETHTNFTCEFRLLINGVQVFQDERRWPMDHVCLFDLRIQFTAKEWHNLNGHLQRGWNHVESSCTIKKNQTQNGTVKCCGIQLYTERTNLDDVSFITPDLHGSGMAYDNMNSGSEIYDEECKDVALPPVSPKYFDEIAKFMEGLRSSRRKNDDEYEQDSGIPDLNEEPLTSFVSPDLHGLDISYDNVDNYSDIYDEESRTYDNDYDFDDEEEQCLTFTNSQISESCEVVIKDKGRGIAYRDNPEKERSDDTWDSMILEYLRGETSDKDGKTSKIFLDSIAEEEQEPMFQKRRKLKEDVNLVLGSTSTASTSTNKGGQQKNGPSNIKISEKDASIKRKAEATVHFKQNKAEKSHTPLPEGRANQQSAAKEIEDGLISTEAFITEDNMDAFYASLETETTALSDTQINTVFVNTRPSEETQKALQILRDFVSKKFSLLLQPRESKLIKYILEYLLSLSPDDGISLKAKSVVLQLSRSFTRWSLDYNDASHKLESAGADLAKVDELKEGLEANVREFREVEKFENEMWSKLADMEEEKRKLEEQINAIKAQIADYTSSKDTAAQRKRMVFDEGRRLKAQGDDLRNRVPRLRAEEEWAKITQANIEDEWSKLGEKFIASSSFEDWS